MLRHINLTFHLGGAVSSIRFVSIWCVCLGLALGAAVSSAQERGGAAPSKVVVENDGTVEVPAQAVPTSRFLSPEAKAYVTQHLKDMENPELLKQDAGVPRFMKPYLARDHALFAVARKDATIGGVHVYVYTPESGIAAKNKNRILIDLHGGGFSGCWPGCAELESIPIAALGRIEVVSVDYREGPKYKFPAASEDVAAVYRELLKSHKPRNIGIYGCSAGGMQTAMSVAWFETHALPTPGAIGIFCASAGGGLGGDASYTALPLGEARLAPHNAPGQLPPLGYFQGANANDPQVDPLDSPEILAKFPPTLIITGTRDFFLSSAVYTHEQLVKLGVDAELHVWEGLFHGFFYNPDVPESKDALRVIVSFFDKHLAGPHSH